MMPVDQTRGEVLAGLVVMLIAFAMIALKDESEPNRPTQNLDKMEHASVIEQGRLNGKRYLITCVEGQVVVHNYNGTAALDQNCTVR